MGFFNNISFGYKVMLIGIVVFVIGVIIMFIENKIKKRRPEDIKNNYLVKNNVRTSENPNINNNSMYINSQSTNDYSTNLTQQRNEYPKISEHNELNNNPVINNTNNNINSSSELMDMYK